MLTVVETLSRCVPELYPRFNYRAENVVSALDKASSRIGYPRTIRVDNGSEFV